MGSADLIFLPLALCYVVRLVLVHNHSDAASEIQNLIMHQIQISDIFNISLLVHWPGNCPWGHWWGSVRSCYTHASSLPLISVILLSTEIIRINHRVDFSESILQTVSGQRPRQSKRLWASELFSFLFVFENNEEIIEKFQGSVLILGLPGLLLIRQWLIVMRLIKWNRPFWFIQPLTG